jgi:hypothetical protein
MNDRKSPNKIKKEKQIYFHQKDSPIKWSDIKHLTLEDDDIIRSEWDDDGDFYGMVVRMVEETDEEFQKRLSDNELHNKWEKERRYESYLRLKKEFEDGK